MQKLKYTKVNAGSLLIGLALTLGAFGALLWQGPVDLDHQREAEVSESERLPGSDEAKALRNQRNTEIKKQHKIDLSSRSWGLFGPIGLDAPKAWKQVKGGSCANSQTVVAVIDTGIDPSHPDLKNALWRNSRETKNSKDSDGNGFADDLHGWDFVTQSGTLVDRHGHGTHIAGIIAATGDEGLKGVCPGVKIMSLRYYDEGASGQQNLNNTIAAINYAIDNGADIINYSGGGAEFAQKEFEALSRARSRGILVVAAAGNERSDADKRHYYPAAYDLDNILSVTAVDQRGNILSSSNWGTQKVHIAAPGHAVYSTMPGSGYGVMTGTSQATAFVSGIAALLKTQQRNLSVAQVKEIIKGSAVARESLKGKARVAATANAYQALKRLNKNNGTIAAQERKVSSRDGQ